MRTSFSRSVLAAAVLLAAAIPAEMLAAPSARKAALMTTQVRVDVDATGRVVAAEPGEGVDGALADAIRSHAKGWTFEAPVRDGKPVGGTTFVRAQLCAAEDAGSGGLVVSVGSVNNGPGVDPRMMRPSFFPPISEELVRLGRMEVEAVYEVGVDGRATVLSVATVPDRARLRHSTEVALRKWLAPMRFEPERIDGTPVATRMQLPITFTFEQGSAPRARDLEKRLIDENPTCQALLKGRPDAPRPQVALDSPFAAPPGT